MAHKETPTVLELGENFYLPASSGSPPSFDFHALSPSSAAEFNVSGSIDSQFTGKSGSEGFGGHYSKAAVGGITSRFLENRGFGWLLEVDEEDDNYGTSLLDELDIDVRDIYYKVRCVMLPLPYFRLKLQLVRESPDFWGPLFIVLAYALLSLYGQFKVVSFILTIWFLGSFLVFFLARVLGGEVSYSQCLGIIGYCLIPLVIMGAVLPFLNKFHYLSLFLKLFGIIWAVYSAGILLCGEELQHKRSLLLYPILLLYIYFFSLYTGV